jgi:regulator of protease activity HflC (stomatin/prohibitin superfamily)
MPDLRNFLSRFRPAGTPGAPTRGGVPADRVAEREAEIQPVLELLEETRTQAERIRAAARVAADGRRERARQQADALVAAARLRAGAERTAARNRGLQAVSDERRRAEAEAVRLTGRIVELARGRLDALAAQAAAPVLAALEPVGDRTAGPTRRTPCDESSAARR